MRTTIKKYYTRKGREIIRGITDDMCMPLYEMAETLGLPCKQFLHRIIGAVRWKDLEIRWLTEIEGMDPDLFVYDDDDLEEDPEIDQRAEKKNLKKYLAPKK